MIGLVLVTHGQLAEEFRNAVEHVVGPQENFETVSHRRRTTTWSSAASDIVDAVARADNGDRASSFSPTCSAARRPTSPFP